MEILTGVRSGSLSSLSMATSPFSAPAPGPERQILVNEDAQRPSGANGDGGLDVEVLGHDLLTGLGGGLLGRLTNGAHEIRSEEHTSELQSLMRISYAVFCLKKKNKKDKPYNQVEQTTTK